MTNIKNVFIGMVRRLKFGLVIALIAGFFGIVLYYMGRPIADLYSVNEKIDVAVTDSDASVLSTQMKIYLSEKINMNLIEDNPETFSDKLINRDVSAIIEIPESFEERMLAGENVKIKATTLDDYENGAYTVVYISGFMESAYAAAQAADGNKELFENILSSDSYETVLSVENAVVSDREDEYVAAGFSFAGGFMLMLVTAAGIFVTLAVMDDRQYGTYSRMSISSVTGTQYIVGTLGASVIVSLLTLLPLPLFLIFTNAPMGVNTWLLLIVILLYSLFNSALSIMLAQLINSKQALATLSGCITSIGCLLGGAWFPIEESAGALRYLSYITPQYWYINCISGNADEPLVNVCIIGLYAVLIMLASAALFNRKRIAAAV